MYNPVCEDKQRKVVYLLYRYGGLLAIAILAVGSLLVAVGLPPVASPCNTPVLIIQGLWHFSPHCWFVLGLVVLMSTPAIVLAFLLGYAVQNKDFRLGIISMIIFLLILIALVHPY